MASLYSAFEGADGFEFLRGEGEEVAELADGADGILRLPPPIVPLLIGNVAPERVAPRFTGRLVFLDPAVVVGDTGPGRARSALQIRSSRRDASNKNRDVKSPRRGGSGMTLLASRVPARHSR